MAAYRQAKRMQRGVLTAQGGFSTTDPALLQMPCTIQCVFVAKEFRSERTQILFDTRGDSVGPRIDITTSNNLFVASNYTSISKPAILDKIYDVVFAVSKDSTDVYIDGEKEATLASGEANMTRLNLGANSAIFYGDWLMYRQFNYLMSADEVKALDNNNDPMGYVVPKASRYFERSYHSNFTEGTDGWGIAGGSHNLSVVSNGGILELSGNYDAYQIMRAVGDAPKYASKYKVRIELEERISLSSFLFFPFSTTTFVVGSFSEPTDVLEGVTNKPSDILSRNCYLYIYGLKPNDLVRIKSISVEPIGLIAEYLPQNLMEYPNAGDLDVLSPNSYTWTGPDDSNYGISIPLSGYIIAKKCVVTIEVSNYEAGAPFFKISTANSTSIPQQNGTFELEQIILGDAYNRVAIYGGNVGTDRRMTITVKRIRQINGISYSWLDSAKQLPLSDEYMEPLFQSIGGYDMAANGAPEILYNE